MVWLSGHDAGLASPAAVVAGPSPADLHAFFARAAEEMRLLVICHGPSGEQPEAPLAADHVVHDSFFLCL